MEDYERKKQQEKEAWFKEHNEYLKSDIWKAKRIKRIKHDKYICQGCLEAEAVQVHHLSYNHWQNEFMFELISVCEDCHEKIHYTGV